MVKRSFLLVLSLLTLACESVGDFGCHVSEETGRLKCCWDCPDLNIKEGEPGERPDLDVQHTRRSGGTVS